MTDEDLPEPGETKNELHGDVSGNAFQARDVHGDVNLGRDFYFIDRTAAEPAPRRHPARTLLPFVPHLVAAVLFGSLAVVALPRVWAVLAVLAPFGLVALLFRRWRLVDKCTPAVLREARPAALTALAALTVVLALGVLVAPPRLWDGYPDRDAVVLALLFTDVAALSVWQVLRRR